MATKPKILAFAGSLRNDSTNKKTVKIAMKGARESGAEVTYIDLKQYPLPVYDGDIEVESGIPENALKLQELMLENEGFLIASPEYNSSVSGALKNMIDWTSRPNGDLEAGACYSGKVVSIMSASPGELGGLRGLFDIRKILSTMGVIVLPGQYAVYGSFKAFNDAGNLIDGESQEAVERLGSNVAKMLEKLNK
ncbi:MAG: NAD(P)H-dependent oxidoreductase [Pyrinomonadaceae bacterium]|nr:NAD(P)H-dependent oxidoreductase [Pyrinomonadaceae bacterium]